MIGLSLVVPAPASEGYAKIIRLEGQDPLLDAARVSLGMLGVISKVRLKKSPNSIKFSPFVLSFSSDVQLGFQEIFHDCS